MLPPVSPTMLSADAGSSIVTSSQYGAERELVNGELQRRRDRQSRRQRAGSTEVRPRVENEILHEVQR